MSADTAPVEHADSGRDNQQMAKENIAQILALRQGREKAISSKELAERTPVNDSTVRDLIPQVIEEYRLPITNCPDGYFRLGPREHEEFVRTMREYESRRDAARERMQALTRAYYGHKQASGGWS